MKRFTILLLFLTNLIIAQTTIDFAGITWDVKSGTGLGPGPNSWSSSTNNVWVDGNGDLHLKITYQGGVWYCAEVVSQESFGYGEYIFYVASRVDLLDKNVVGGLFTYKYIGATQTPQEYEIDIEFSTWQGSILPNNSQYVFQYRLQSNPVNQITPHRFNMSLSGDYTTHKWIWQEDNIFFQSYHGHYPTIPSPQSSYLISETTFNDSRVPPECDEKLILNLWLIGGTPPFNGQEVEMIIKDVIVPPQPVPCNNIISIGGCGSGYFKTYTSGGTGVWNTSTNNSCNYETPGEEQIYSFVAPTTGTYSIEVITASGYVDYQWKSGSCSSGGWTCIDAINSAGTYGSMSWTAGSTYYILLDDENAYASTHAFYINCPTTIDPCNSIIPISGCGSSYTETYTGGGTGVWASNPCYTSPGVEQIYSFVAPATDIYSIEVVTTGGDFVDFLWKSGSCSSGGWTCIGDIANPGSYGNMSWTAGTTYYILLDDENTIAETFTFYINSPACGGYCSGTTTLTNCTGNFDDGSGTNDYLNDSDCKWLIQPSGATSITLSFSSFSIENGYDFVEVYDGTTTSANLLDSYSGTTIPSNVTSSGGNMLVHFTSDFSNTSSGWSADYTCNSGGSPVTNDFCTNAITLTPGTSCNYTSATTVGATNSPTTPLPTCANFSTNSMDVWFEFVATSTSHTIDTDVGLITDGAMALYSACGGTLIECDDDDSNNGLMASITRTDFIIGNTYIIRFWAYSSFATGTFDICVDYLVGIEKIDFINSLSIYPNPTSGEFTLEMEITKPEAMQLKLFNLTGQILLEENLELSSGTFTKTIDMGKYAKGVHTLQLITDEGIINRKIVLE